MYRMQEVVSSESNLCGRTGVLCHTAIRSNVSRLVLHSFSPRKQVLMSTRATWIGEEMLFPVFPSNDPRLLYMNRLKTGGSLCLIITQLVVQQGVVGIESHRITEYFVFGCGFNQTQMCLLPSQCTRCTEGALACPRNSQNI